MQFNTINLEDILAIFLTGMAALIPIAGLTARFALKPIVEAIARMREGQGAGEALRMVERRLVLLEQEVQNLGALRDDVARIAEAQEFQLRLSTPREPMVSHDA